MFIYSLFFGATDEYCPIVISSIRIIETATNYQEIIEMISLFDRVLSGDMVKKKKIGCSSLLILNHLIYERKENKFDPFIYNSWKLFCKKKRKLK